MVSFFQVSRHKAEKKKKGATGMAAPFVRSYLYIQITEFA
ncbi:hypothetical protein ACP_3013 [Acidobacterium capsulatum ATCC 51196]|uniref:Uncharacterized protein n=1 Tax=Acidobacterium capsulatum (strain ATCC 51196 / DSM 11244 / BCRC 80197 / JCM 7670 / NBRC 15755 / NCIMB 13165 / 161) TaxID=240015 RepID=C1F4H0_ACIC5|nr:hypothetical protein ACP_3013 [Acidobacterium capsulatum ATCC 51196]